MMLTLLGAAALIQTIFGGRFLVNITPSVPRGIYWISQGKLPEREDLVALSIPEDVRELLYERKYTPRAIKLLAKPIAAIGGDHVCDTDGRLVINGQVRGAVLEVDRQGRPLPHRLVCRRLAENEVFLATKHDNSFDSRNFGPVATSLLRGTLIPLITF